MQGLHHQQHQLAALLSAALPKDPGNDPPSPPSPSPPPPPPSSLSPSSSAKLAVASSSAADPDESARLGAINSLHRAILYPPNSLLVAHSASFLSQGLSRLLSDQSYSVRPAAATALGALCAVVCSIPITSNPRQNHVVLGAMVDRFISWALPLLNNVSVGDGPAELALDSLREFLNVGDVNGIERYALPILKACQQLLENERTSLNLLHRLLGVLTLISLKFLRCFQPHFLDIVDLLLGWALVPDLAESDRRVIMDCFLQFQKHWVGNLQFSLGLLLKFLGDMETLLHDGGLGTTQQFRRLLALLSCFSAVLQSTASGLLELNLLEQIGEPLSKMLPRFLASLSIVGRRFGWSKWYGDLWRCLTLLAEILREKFAAFYPLTIDILFQSLDLNNDESPSQVEKVSPVHVHGILKTNLQLLSLQKLGLLPLSVQKILYFNSPVSRLRLHPNHVVTASSAATYVFLLQHGNLEVVEQAMALLLVELKTLRSMVEEALSNGNRVYNSDSKSYSQLELFALMKFDLKVLLTCVVLDGIETLVGQPDIAILYLKRSDALICFIFENMDPFDSLIMACVDLQVSILDTLERLCKIKFLCKYVTWDEKAVDTYHRNLHSAVVEEHVRKYSRLLVQALHASSPLAVKLKALGWIQRFCEDVINLVKHKETDLYLFKSFIHSGALWNIVASVLDAASDEEQKVRSHVASVLELLLKAGLVHGMGLCQIAHTVLGKLGDPDNNIKNTFIGLLSNVLPAVVYSCGLCDGTVLACRPYSTEVNSSPSLWKQIFSLRQLPQQLQAQQLVSVLSYISQRWKMPLSSWIQRLIPSCRKSKDLLPNQSEDGGDLIVSESWLDIQVDEEFLEKVCFSNVLAGAWWAVQEAARYCVSTRLRTNLGGPSQTFAALERMLLDIAHVLHLENEQNDGSLSIINSSGAHLLPMRLLLDFVEALKKNVYNAYEGSTVLSPVSRASLLFFRANKKVCEEWFSRICEPMMNAGLALQCPYATIQYCSLRLFELSGFVSSALKDKSRVQKSNLESIRNRISGNVLRILRYMALALCRSHEPEALSGLLTWASQTFFSLFVEDNQSIDHSGIPGQFTWITGLVHQAEGHYERAAAYFTHLLQSEDSLSSMDSDGVQFVIARIIESYSALSDWKSLESWLLELQMLRAKHAGKSYSGALTTAGNEINAIHALSRFDEGDLHAAWAYLDLTPKSSAELALDPKLALQRSEQMLLQALLLQAEGKVDKLPQDLQKAKLMLDETLSVVALDGLEDAAAVANQLHCIAAFEDGFDIEGREDRSKHFNSIYPSCFQLMQSPINKTRQDCSLWLKVLRVYRTISPSSPVALNLSMNLSSLARRQKNVILAHHLNDYIRDSLPRCSEERFRNYLASNLEYERILLTYAESNYSDAFTGLWLYLRPCIISSESPVSDANESMLKARACLKLLNWLRDHSESFREIIFQRMEEDFYYPIVHSIDRDRTFSSDGILNSKQCAGPIIDEIMGTIAKLSTQLCPYMAKSWMSYGIWCFNQAQNSILNPHDSLLKLCLISPLLTSEVQPGRFMLSEDEAERVRSVISQIFLKLGNKSGLNHVVDKQHVNIVPSEDLSNNHIFKALMQQVMNIIEAAAGAHVAEESNGERLSTIVSSRIQTSFLNANVSLEVNELDQLIDIWWTLRKRRVSLFGYAAQGFTQCLSYACSKVCSNELIESGNKSLKTGSYALKATLYLLRILLNYGVELQDTLEPSLSASPLWPWQEIIPQLFARLSSHPEQVVRRQLRSLLMMLGKQSPWSIVYPTLVDVNANQDKQSEELQQILSCLRELHPRLIQDVQLMIDELSNMTVLWEELWLSTLQDVHADVMRRIHVLREEVARIAENTTLSQSEKNKINAAKYSAMMAPIILTLERRLASTSSKPETPHELWFHQQFMEQLRSAILSFKTPPKSASALGDVWRPFDVIAASLASYQRKSSVSLCEVAPQLALLSSSDVPMPGLEKEVNDSKSDGGLASSQGIITISSFSEQVVILSTKTKPKKINIMGSDGQKYTYLLKGREDLRLDARIMQLLQAINCLLHSSSATCTQPINIRYYSVTPISGRAGLIQWVHNVISIYSVFKSWKIRAQAAQFSSSATGEIKNISHSVPHPSDMFYGKIIPALKEKGIKRVISRRDWPQDVKRKVLMDLIKEVPRQLLYQELWCASEGFKAFNLKLKRYSGSIAAMSIVGHILGLGDRHLDNILIDFFSGDIVHIDYNVCFDKGRKLKVPEIVPFRLTHTIEAALGLTGIEGTFRANCEAVMGVLRKNKDILLMLLEVFVWDPLVEWTRGDFHDDAAIAGEERKGMELAVSLSLFSSRVQEIRVPLQEHHDLLLSSLPAVESALERFADVLNKYELVSALFCRVDQERSNLILHETSAKSIVTEVTCNSEKIRASFEIHAREYSQAKVTVAEKAKEATTWIEQHGKVLDALRSSTVAELYMWIKLNNERDSLSLTSAVSMVGIPLSVVPEPTQAQCDDIDREIWQLVVDLDHGVASALTALQVYSLALQRILPLNYHTTSTVNAWAQVLQLCSDVVSSDALSIARRRAAELVSSTLTVGHDSTKLVHDNLCHTLEKCALDVEKVEEERGELVNSVGSETESKAKDRVISSFVKFMQSSVTEQRDDTHYDVRNQNDLSERKEKAIFVLNLAVIALYTDVKERVLGIGDIVGVGSSYDFFTFHGELERQVEKCYLFGEFLNEASQFALSETPKHPMDLVNQDSDRKMPSTFKSNLVSYKSFINQMTEAVLPDLARAVLSSNSEVLDMFESITQVRASIDTALEQLVEVEMERLSLIELEKNYFVKVGLITEKQLALKEASLKGRDHLSWEEAEELVSQEEACRIQLDQLHQTWNQRDKRAYYLHKREAEAKNSLMSCESHFQTLFSAEEDGDLHLSRTKALLTPLVKPFMYLELTDRVLPSLTDGSAFSDVAHRLADNWGFGQSVSEYVWKIGGLVNSHAFFIWKIYVMDAFVDSCIQDIASSLDQSLGFDQLISVLRRKLAAQLERHISLYLIKRFIPALVSWLEKEIEQLKQLNGASREFTFHYLRDLGAVKKVELMLQEYSNTHETAQAARSAACVMERQVKELREAICRTGIEIVQMEWMHDTLVAPSQSSIIALQKFLPVNDDLRPLIMSLSRSKLLDIIQSSVVRIAQSIEGLQSIERTSVAAQGQLERAMAWACGGPTPAKTSGIPPEFHQHLLRRKQLMWDAREKASDIVKVCMSILEFEASRDGILWVPGEVRPFATGSDNRAWQQVYFNAVTRLEVTYHSFSRIEQEWNLAQSNMEAASSGLYSATNELCIASLKAKTASDDLQSTVLAMRDCAYESSVALSAFGHVSRTHTALTSECGSMLEEVLAMTDDLHDVYSLGKEAAAMHCSLLDHISKANSILLPLESVLSKDVAAMTDAIERERETKLEISPIHGQAIYQSYSSRIREASQTLKPLVLPLMLSVKGLFSLLTRLARTASLHAGNLHKAFEGVGESQRDRSGGLDLLKADFDGGASSSFDSEGGEQSRYDEGETQETLQLSGLSLQERGWISPPDSICTCSSESECSPAKGCVLDLDDPTEMSQAKLLEFKDPVGSTGGVSDEENPVRSAHSLRTNGELKSGAKDGISSDRAGTADYYDEAFSTNRHPNGPVIRGKNTYAMSVLKRVEMKLDGRDISDTRRISIAEQVDYLLKQATSVDNLCNMYEGWTPWI